MWSINITMLWSAYVISMVRCFLSVVTTFVYRLHGRLRSIEISSYKCMRVNVYVCFSRNNAISAT